MIALEIVPSFGEHGGRLSVSAWQVRLYGRVPRAGPVALGKLARVLASPVPVGTLLSVGEGLEDLALVATLNGRVRDGADLQALAEVVFEEARRRKS